MGFLADLFNRNKEKVTSRDLKVAMMGVKRNRRKKQLEVRKLSAKRNDLIERMKNSRRDGNSMEVDFVWEELRQIKVDAAYARRESKILNLEAIALTRFLRGMERLEKTSDSGRIKDLIDKVRVSGLSEELLKGEVDEQVYMDTLNAVLDEVGLEIEEMESISDEDPEKAKFLAEIDEIVAAEEEGNLDVAVEREERLKDKMDEEDARPMSESEDW